MNKEYFTIMNDCEVSFEERKSLFMCNIKRIHDESEAMEFINSIKTKYKDATHNVYAYITNNEISMRYSDDGEPKGTAGPPVLEVLKREGLNNVAVVVTRYFGGILLGAGGLIRAYAGSCKQGVDAGKKVRVSTGNKFTLEIDYDKYGKINNYFQDKNIKIADVLFMEKIKMDIICLEKDLENIKNDLFEMLNGNDIIIKSVVISCFTDENDNLLEVVS